MGNLFGAYTSTAAPEDAAGTLPVKKSDEVVRVDSAEKSDEDDETSSLPEYVEVGVSDSGTNDTGGSGGGSVSKPLKVARIDSVTNALEAAFTGSLTKSARVPLTKYYREVFIDLETTGFGYASHITQLAAYGPGVAFDRYVKPKKPIDFRASEVTGLSFKAGKMFFRGQLVQSVSLHECLQDFFKFLGDEPCILVAHNAFSFDAGVLVTSVLNSGFWNHMELCVVGFMDTLPLFRKEYPNLPNKHSQRALVDEFLKESYEEHNALWDVMTLWKLLDHCQFGSETKRLHTCSLEFIKDKIMSRKLKIAK